jgi:hypothetical protein
MSQQEIAGIIKRIEELVIEAAHRGVSEDEIMKAVNDGLDLVLGPAEDDEWDEE